MGNLYFENSESTFLVSHRKALSHHMPVSHFHSTYEIYVLMAGQREFFIQDRTITIAEGDVVIISPNVLHRTTNAERPRHERLIINMHAQYFSVDGSHEEALQPLLQRDYLILKGSLRSRELIDMHTRAIMQEMKERGSGFELYAQTLPCSCLSCAVDISGRMMRNHLQRRVPCMSVFQKLSVILMTITWRNSRFICWQISSISVLII